MSTDLNWLQFLHKAVMADPGNECVLGNFGEGRLTIDISHRLPGTHIHHRFVYTAADQRDSELMIRAVMDQARVLNREVQMMKRKGEPMWPSSKR